MSSSGKKRRHTKPVTVSTQPAPSSTISRHLQQRCLDVFKDALWTSSEDLSTVQEVKGHLYNRDFAQAFSRPDYLRAYALRWSASRALGYAAIFEDIEQCLTDKADMRVLCLGGGAGAEVVGLAARSARGNASAVTIHAVDIADWKDVLDRLHSSITETPKLSQYASAAAQAKNKSMLTRDAFIMSFTQADVLQWDAATIERACSDTGLITVMFTLNELYASSISKTQQLLATITAVAEDGTLLLVVDSPGSYSTVSINGAEKRYPMHWLLDLTLLGPDRDDDNTQWTKLVSEESKWFRLPEYLQYPVELENMRYQIHLYRRRRKMLRDA
ncbi:hypothetical protein AMS68_001004 [Peltaster fructicola]|uniref:Histidine-specific methyltransferase SAM-dependent domain-containing protein n=1 Tax=Peltaster fructicola TaxID=286661 RepID=A0A6H0XL64_9PEZI|nr:hypothetical protein AMS68_001004 [Peltaster fructicola]